MDHKETQQVVPEITVSIKLWDITTRQIWTFSQRLEWAQTTLDQALTAHITSLREACEQSLQCKHQEAT